MCPATNHFNQEDDDLNAGIIGFDSSPRGTRVRCRMLSFGLAEEIRSIEFRQQGRVGEMARHRRRGHVATTGRCASRYGRWEFD